MKKKPVFKILARNPIASALKSPHLKPKVKVSKKIYKRKPKYETRPE